MRKILAILMTLCMIIGLTAEADRICQITQEAATGSKETDSKVAYLKMNSSPGSKA